jgi:hypothetical protein
MLARRRKGRLSGCGELIALQYSGEHSYAGDPLSPFGAEAISSRLRAHATDLATFFGSETIRSDLATPL